MQAKQEADETLRKALITEQEKADHLKFTYSKLVNDLQAQVTELQSKLQDAEKTLTKQETSFEVTLSKVKKDLAQQMEKSAAALDFCSELEAEAAAAREELSKFQESSSELCDRLTAEAEARKGELENLL